MLQLKSINLKKEKMTTLIVPVCKDKDIHDNSDVSKLVTSAKKVKEFKGRANQELIFYNPPGVKVKKVVFLGIGKLKEIDPETLRSISGKAVKKCIKWKLSDVLFAVPAAQKVKLKMTDVLGAMMEGAFLANYIFDRYKKEKKDKKLTRLKFLVKPDTAKKQRRLPARIRKICSGTLMAREWVSTPSNDKRPGQFARSISAAAKKAKLKVSVITESQMKKKKMGSLLSVSAGSTSSARMMILEHNPRGAKKTIVLAGKGVTFDSGGINLKPGSGLDTMKMDMGGAASVAAALITAANLKLKTKIIGILPLVENMPSGSATRPGDIVKSLSGKTIEIGNTDAEGRLILIDAITYALKQYKPDTIIDMATLTGACVVALGEKIAGVFSSDDKLAKSIVESGEKTHERCWHMPLPDDYKPLLKSDLADINNVSSARWGGAITAALFLKEFTEDTQWAHIDIAGPAYTKKAEDYCPPGGTGFGVRLLCDWLEKQ